MDGRWWTALIWLIVGTNVGLLELMSILVT